MECCWRKIEVSTSINQTTTKKKWPMKTLTSINCLKQLFIWIWLVQGIKDRDWSIGESFVWHFLWHVSPFSFSFSPLCSHRISPYSTPVCSVQFQRYSLIVEEFLLARFHSLWSCSIWFQKVLCSFELFCLIFNSLIRFRTVLCG